MLYVSTVVCVCMIEKPEKEVLLDVIGNQVESIVLELATDTRMATWKEPFNLVVIATGYFHAILDNRS